MVSNRFLKPGFDPRDLKVTELKSILRTNDVRFHNKATKSVLLKLYHIEIEPKLDLLRERENKKLEKKNSSDNDKKEQSKEKENISLDLTNDSITSRKRRHLDDDFFDNDKKSNTSVISTSSPKLKKIKKDDNTVDKNGPPILSSNLKEDASTPSVTQHSHDDSRNENSVLSSQSFSKKLDPSEIQLYDSSYFQSIQNSGSKIISGDNDSNKRLAPDLYLLEKNLNTPTKPTYILEKNQPTLINLVDELREEENFADSEKRESSVFESEKETTPTSQSSENENETKNEVTTTNAENWFIEKLSVSLKSIFFLIESITAFFFMSFILAYSIVVDSIKIIRKVESIPIFSKLKYFSTFLLIAIPIWFSVWYREQRVAIGYCNSELPLIPIFHSQQNYIPNFLNNFDSWMQTTFKPDCIPCPKHAECSTNMNMICDSGYEKYNVFPVISSLLSLPSTCRDEEEPLITNFVNDIIRHLKNENTEAFISTDEFKFIQLTKTRLFDHLKHLHSPEIDGIDLARLFSKTIDKLKENSKIHWIEKPSSEQHIYDDYGDEIIQIEELFYFTGQNLAPIPLLKHTRQFIVTYYVYIVGLFLILFVSTIIQRRVLRRFSRDFDNTEMIEDDIMDCLRDLKLDDNDETILNSRQIEEKFLKQFDNIKYKKWLLARLETRLLLDQRVKNTTIELSGESIKCWEWNN